MKQFVVKVGESYFNSEESGIQYLDTENMSLYDEGTAKYIVRYLSDMGIKGEVIEYLGEF